MIIIILLLLEGGFDTWASGAGSVACLNIWKGLLSEQEMFAAAGCNLIGDVYHMSQTIQLAGCHEEAQQHPDFNTEIG